MGSASQKLVAFGALTLGVLSLASAVSTIQFQPSDPATERRILVAVASVFHAAYGDEPYSVTQTDDHSMALEQVDGRLLMSVHRVSDEPCTFIAAHRILGNIIVEKLDLTKFDGKYDLQEACLGLFSLKTLCQYRLDFGTGEGYCRAGFSDTTAIDLDKPSFATGTCGQFVLGPRQRQLQEQYIKAFDFAYRQCGEKK